MEEQKIFINISGIAHHSKGIGLGLSICKKVVELHEGQIAAASRKGKGTTVTIVLPKV